MTAIIGVVALGAAGAGFLLTFATRPERVLLLVGALCLIKPGIVTDIAGFGSLAIVLLLQSRRVRPPLPGKTY